MIKYKQNKETEEETFTTPGLNTQTVQYCEQEKTNCQTFIDDYN